MTKTILQEFDWFPFPKAIKETVADNLASTFAAGKNAAYLAKTKKIVLPENLLPAGFHELGHAANVNFGKVTKVLQKSRPLMLLSAPIALIAMFKTKKSTPPEGAVDKATTFIKENAGKLTLAAFVPMLAEEAIATIKGNGFAKKLLSPELAGKVAKTNAIGFATYALTAVGTALAVTVRVKVKDAITDRSIAKKQLTRR